MITLADTLTPQHIALDPEVTDRAGAMRKSARAVQDDPRVLDWGHFDISALRSVFLSLRG
jgi:hypothetical protein